MKDPVIWASRQIHLERIELMLLVELARKSRNGEVELEPDYIAKWMIGTAPIHIDPDAAAKQVVWNLIHLGLMSEVVPGMICFSLHLDGGR